MATKTTTPKPKITNDVLHVGYVLDASPSIQQYGLVETFRTAVREYVTDLRKEEKKIRRKFGKGEYTHFTLTAFDTITRPLVETQPVDAFDLDEVADSYAITGWGTALLDAVDETITQMERIVKPGEKVLVVIMTDGEENSSTRTNASALKERVSAKEAEGWSFTWLGSNLKPEQTYAAAASIGISRGATAMYTAEADSVGYAMASVSGVTSGLRASDMYGKAFNQTMYASNVGTNDFRNEDEIGNDPDDGATS